MKSYYRIMLGRKSIHAKECLAGSFIGADYGIEGDLTRKLSNDWKAFNKELIPVYMAKNPKKTKVAAGLSCGALWTIAQGIKKDDIVLCPNGEGSYLVGEVLDAYSYHAGEILPHRRTVKWYPGAIARSAMSQPLQNSCGAIGTVSTITKFTDEIELLIAGKAPATIVSTDETVEDPSEFAMETHLEDFLVQNWAQTDLGKNYDIFQDEGETEGKQYRTDAGTIDILAISKDKKTLLVVELKKGRSGDAVVGQTLRYMGFVKEMLAEDNQAVKGIIIAHEDDPKIRWALSATQNIEFYWYQVSFKLVKA